MIALANDCMQVLLPPLLVGTNPLFENALGFFDI